MGIKRTELIRQIDLWPLKKCFRNKIGQKRQKYRKPNFPLYFWQNPLYFFNGLLGSLNGLKWIFCSKYVENMLTPTTHVSILKSHLQCVTASRLLPMDWLTNLNPEPE